MPYTAQVEILNSYQNTETKDTITSFLIRNVPAVVQIELLTHGLLAVNSESSRARPVASVASQVVHDPYLPTWTMNQKGMSGKYADQETSDQADILAKRHARNCLTFARDLADLGIHKQDANKIALSPFTFNNVIVTATQWTNFISLRTADTAHPVMQSIAGQIKQLLTLPPIQKLDRSGFFTPYPDLPTIEAIAKTATVSYARQDNQMTSERALSVFNDLYDNKHASPFAMAAKPVVPGQRLIYQRRDGTKMDYIIFDNFRKPISAIKYAESYWYDLVDTDNLSGFVSVRRLEGL